MKLAHSIALTAAFLGMAGITTWSLVRDRAPEAGPAGETSTFRPQFIAGAIQPIPDDLPFDARKIELGRRLFHDGRLSNDGTVSCATCHQIATGGADGLAFPKGIYGQIGNINTPTVLNSRFNFKQFWDGRADTLEDQVDGPITHPKEMGATWAKVIERIQADSAYAAEFTAVYSDGLTVDNVKDAIAEFERYLVTPNSRFDRFLRGDETAMTDQEQAGWQLFQEIGCTTCHQGVNLGGNMFQSFGVVGDYIKDRGGETEADLGRYNVTKKPRDKHLFKVPTLRNVDLTGPYFHDAEGKSLDEAVQVMALYQLGVELEQGDVEKIVAFLKALTGEIPK